MENFETKEIIKDPYRARQMDTFRYLETYPNNWQMCEIKDITHDANMREILIFDIPSNYDLVMPTMDRFKIEGCQLCGHDIIYPYPIKCDSKKIYMFVGSECVNNFQGAGYITKTIKVFKESKARQKFLTAVDDLIIQCESFKETSYYGSERIEYNHYKFIQKLEKAKREIEQLSTRKIENLLKKAEKELKLVIRTEDQINIVNEEKKISEEKIKAERQEKIKRLAQALRNNDLNYLEFRDIGAIAVVNNNKNAMVRNTLNSNQIESIKQFGAYFDSNCDYWIIKL